MGWLGDGAATGMVIGILQFELLVHDAESLKDKRRVVRSIGICQGDGLGDAVGGEVAEEHAAGARGPAAEDPQRAGGDGDASRASLVDLDIDRADGPRLTRGDDEVVGHAVVDGALLLGAEAGGGVGDRIGDGWAGGIPADLRPLATRRSGKAAQRGRAGGERAVAEQHHLSRGGTGRHRQTGAHHKLDRCFHGSHSSQNK
ncbi:DUF503 domain-containing protein [Leptolyngbya sp. 15MV]|nr:DUF503 domain-containing protein [Leptolyngbya sp. 15MV]